VPGFSEIAHRWVKKFMQTPEKEFLKALAILPQIGYNKLLVPVKSNSQLPVIAYKENKATNRSLIVILAIPVK
jgi:hypothetical protein